ncbi:1-(5-phosphoribosyl)-5-[(5-phosphoribosylamino)methylideneamino]imidazole-4-carboxamide isomerase [Caulobacter segnis]|uniref:1-(5-phosphoribosyl)-5-[(5- phosphoribosylamino)methylideneamino]imidazole-4- carboxamide isomerase n=1 Tax=Caulobacter segnis TaxID=88688 RepID=UPI002410A43B|nr:1-(5-phosphoribosyl)-5-[(5-phosphoribosylamino)methylideneamino]imidazole-4-carboxamide isomerase [Caulobacter segnis]MDG2521516.1 1-(5-phosphoribosyl)-5-[(5-phosphoribosylamino)methylideneamino]imidazole-4-carboxamide isomerase [Caulobacter segnis]
MAPMILYPAIDLKDGQCVRLLHGDMDKATVFNTSAADQAERFAKDGFSWLHVVDLNGAIEGQSMNTKAVEEILNAVSIPVQLGGGVRTLEGVESWIEAGVSRVILGTVAVNNPELVKKAARLWPEQIAVAVDVRDGKVAVDGWTALSDISAVDLSKRFEDAGVAALIVTDISRDGALTGVNVEGVGEVADAVSVPVIASGGVASVDDIVNLKARKGAPIAGAILGRSLYAGTIRPADAIRAAG